MFLGWRTSSALSTISHRFHAHTTTSDKRENKMNENVSGKVRSFVDSVDKLFAEIESWIAQTHLTGKQEEIEIYEEYSGAYMANKLSIEDDKNKKVVEFRPIGAFIIGGNGRIDMFGRIDKAILVHLDPGAPSMTTTMVARDDKETRTISLYRGIDRKGWYWIEDGKRGKANFFTQDLFMELLAEVSDYEVGQHP
jgi:hypothetical protein